ncbi:roadblock/LC7 domain-containing protein [bacterium]|nr:roadblock/LC7 domain-containing protein [bacterium]PIV81286.1 MAG: dynein regulation protein LC7 [bacterium CG17_big_fil_post_rev_8_21_14_2_50_64_8]PJA73479.1 MAG: dynein regulation protein LC7 [bacterium CG_4_9_14_3_um_filter_65_15]
MVRAEWAIFEEDFWAINNVLDDLLKSSKAGNVVLIDRTGQLVSHCGPDVDFDLTSFASLCAADFEANYQLARLIGEDDFSTLYHQGAKDSMFLGKIAKGVVLVVLFDKGTTLGLVRLRVRHAVAELDKIIEGLYDKLEFRNEEYDAFDETFTREVEAEIDSLFAD